MSAALHDLQRWMHQALITPDAVDPAIANALLPGHRLIASECLAIYQRSYILRLRMCLGEQFPATRHALGAPLFAAFADEYLRACPPSSHSLYDLGERFPTWLTETRPDREAPEREDWIDFMVDLAHYERELFRLFDAPGFEDGPWPTTSSDDRTLVLQPCLRLASYQFPVARYYQDVRADRSPAPPTGAPCHLVILRRNYETVTYPVSALHFRFLSTLQQTQNIEAALADIAQWSRRPLNDVTASWTADVRAAWIEAGFFARAQ